MRRRSSLSFSLPHVLPVGTIAAAVGVTALLPFEALSWSGFAGAWIVTAVLALGSRAAFRFTRNQPFVENVLVLGKSDLGRAVIAEMSKLPRYRVLDQPEPSEPVRFFKDGMPLLVPLDRRQRAALQPHLIVIALSDRRGRMPVHALLDAKRQGIAIEDVLHVYERLTGKLALDRLQPSDLIFFGALCRPSIHTVFQRVSSVILAAAGLLLCAPLFAAIALLVKLTSPGPVFFVQERMGKDGRKFQLMKFRTMHPVVVRRSEWVRDNGERITSIGCWLRKFRLDELPQLINVLLGHMNLIGPRPHPASNYELFMNRIPFYSFRSTVRPGMTGWAQVRYGYANNLEEEIEKMRYDFYYIKYHSLRLDAEILLRTIKVVIFGNEMMNGAIRTSGPISSRPQREVLSPGASVSPAMRRSA